MKQVYKVILWNPGLYGKDKNDELTFLSKNLEKARKFILKHFESHYGGNCRVLPSGLGFRQYKNLRMEHYFSADKFWFQILFDWEDYSDVNCEHKTNSKEAVYFGKIEPIMFNKVLDFRYNI